MTLKEMQDIDIRTIEADSLVEYSDITINSDLPKEERLQDVLSQMNGNPYFFKIGKTVVKISHAETNISLDKRMEDFMRTL